MKLLLSALLFLILPVPSQAQDTDRGKLEKNIYYRALVAALAARAQDHAKYPTANDPPKHVIIMRNIDLNLDFPTRVGEVEIEYVNENDLRARYRSVKHDIPVFVMRPMTAEDDRLVIGFTRYWFSARKNRNSMALEGGYNVVVEYDCARKEFVVQSATLWGI